MYFSAGGITKGAESYTNSYYDDESFGLVSVDIYEMKQEEPEQQPS